MHIVSGFISDINGRKDRDLAKYIALGKELLACKINMTVFLEKHIYDLHFSSSKSYPVFTHTYKCKGGTLDGMQYTYQYIVVEHITFVLFERNDMYLWPFKAMAHKFHVNTGNPGKDTLGYMMVQCQKTEWLAIACSLSDKSLSDEFVWMDFGIFHMFHGKIDVFQIELYKMQSRVNKSSNNNKIVAAQCIEPSHAFHSDIYKDITWLFAGSVIGGDKAAISLFSYYMREQCFKILREKNHLMWEINVWAIIYKEHPELFTFYYSDHSEIIVRGYCI